MGWTEITALVGGSPTARRVGAVGLPHGMCGASRGGWREGGPTTSCMRPPLHCVSTATAMNDIHGWEGHKGRGREARQGQQGRGREAAAVEKGERRACGQEGARAESEALEDAPPRRKSTGRAGSTPVDCRTRAGGGAFCPVDVALENAGIAQALLESSLLTFSPLGESWEVLLRSPDTPPPAFPPSGARWLDLIQRLARQAIDRRPGLPGAMPGFNAAGWLAQVFRMRLAVSLQRSLAHAVHTRAGRAMAGASGSRRSASFPAASYSDLMLLTRGY
eukprot:SM000078S22065  [mRNA]  locus=s78:249094:253223:+ [translate_table: standard]